MKGSRVFISRDKDESLQIAQWAESAGIIAHFRSLISLELLPQFPDLRGLDLLFFMSPSAVRLFYSQSPLTFPPLPVAALGAGTAAALPKHIVASFVGKGDPSEVATAFAQFAGNKKVGVITGTESRRRIQKALHPDNYRDLLLYRNSLLPARIAPCDVYVFTSPSNASAFFIKNQLPAHAKVIAIGETTAQRLVELGTQAEIPTNYSTEALWNAIISALTS